MMPVNAIPPDFDPDFASPVEWAVMYRACLLQVVPAKDAAKGRQWKMPDLARWAELQDEIVPQFTFDRWYAPQGDHARRQNMGFLTGRCSGNVFVIDLDDQKGPQAPQWWEGVLALHNNAMDLETVEQRTGGGGRQKLFRAPMDWVAPTNKTSISVDIRGQGGFAMLPPSRHESGKDYEWLAGRAPWEVPIADAPEWLLEAIEALVARHGSRPRTEKTASPDTQRNAFGTRIIEGREGYMRDMIWRVVLELYRANPIPMPAAESAARMEEAWLVYESCVGTRIVEEGLSNADGLERENRGHSLFSNKWRREMKAWGGMRMRQKASEARPKPEAPDFEQAAAKVEEQAKTNAGALFEYLSVDQIKQMPDPEWLIAGLVVENALGFIYGPPGCLKTFIALDMALSFTVGMPDWWGRAIERKGAVVYISSEGQADLKFRIQAWEQHNKVLADDTPFYLIRQTINFMKNEDVGKLLATVQAIADLCGVPITAVFVDTVSRVLPGSDENLQKDMTLFVAACDAVRQRFGATVIGLHHTSRAGNIRGSTVLPGAGDFLLEVRREPGAMNGSVFATKIKSAEDGWEQFFRVEKINLPGIMPQTSLVVAPVDTPPREEGGGWPSTSVCREIINAIEEQWVAREPWCYAINTSRSAIVNISERWELDRDLVKRMLEKWNAEKVIKEDVCDAKNHVRGYRKIAGF